MNNTTIQVVFDKKRFTPHSGVCSSVSWESLKPHIHKAIGVRKREVITGLVVDERGVFVKLTYNEK